MAANPREDDLHGIPMGEEEFERLVGGETSYRYELIDGLLYNMTGSSPEHGAVVNSIFNLIYNHLKGKGPCRVHQDQYVKIPDAPTVGRDKRLVHQSYLTEALFSILFMLQLEPHLGESRAHPHKISR